ncbi:MAG: hypothetical protein LQ343_004029 [Gyalolechia ehrenbergii]|nr:MAG: hypothetical protein LQ343_004029 [Gyalolechia ehrenbergii]
MENNTFTLSKKFVQVRQPGAYCTSLTTQWDTNGLYRSTVYTLDIPCAITHNPGYPFSRTADITPDLLQGAPTSPPLSSPLSHPTDTSNTWPLAAQLLCAGLGVLMLLAVIAAIYIWHKKGSENKDLKYNLHQATAKVRRNNAGQRNGREAANARGVANGAAHNGAGAAPGVQGAVAANHVGQRNGRDAMHNGDTEDAGAHIVDGSDGRIYQAPLPRR